MNESKKSLNSDKTLQSWSASDEEAFDLAAREMNSLGPPDTAQDWSLLQRTIEEFPQPPSHKPRLPEPEVAMWFAERAAVLQPGVVGRPWWNDTAEPVALASETYVPGPAQPPTPPPDVQAQRADIEAGIAAPPEPMEIAADIAVPAPAPPEIAPPPAAVSAPEPAPQPVTSSAPEPEPVAVSMLVPEPLGASAPAPAPPPPPLFDPAAVPFPSPAPPAAAAPGIAIPAVPDIVPVAEPALPGSETPSLGRSLFAGIAQPPVVTPKPTAPDELAEDAPPSAAELRARVFGKAKPAAAPIPPPPTSAPLPNQAAPRAGRSLFGQRRAAAASEVPPPAAAQAAPEPLGFLTQTQPAAAASAPPASPAPDSPPSDPPPSPLLTGPNATIGSPLASPLGAPLASPLGAPRRSGGASSAPPWVAMRPRRRAPWVILAAATALIPIAAAAWWLNPFAETGVPGIVSAPKVSIMAPADGRVSQIMVSNGSRVQPTTDLLVIDAPPPDERKRAELAARLQNAHARADRLDKQIAEMNGILDDLRSRPPDPTGTRQQSEVRLRLIDMKAQKDTATSEARELEQNLANDAARPHGPQTVKAGIDGMVWSIATSDGAEAARGIPLMELADCSHITITLGNRGDAATGLLPGSTVKARIGGGGPLLSGILRLGRGSMTRGESTDTAAGQGVRDAGLQVELNPGELAKLGAASCPVGKPVAIYPE